MQGALYGSGVVVYIEPDQDRLAERCGEWIRVKASLPDSQVVMASPRDALRIARRELSRAERRVKRLER